MSAGSQSKKASIRPSELQRLDLTKPETQDKLDPEMFHQKEKRQPELQCKDNKKKIRCENIQESQTIERDMGQIEEDMDSKLKLDSEYPSDQKNNRGPVKLNTAAILRQGVLYDRQMEEQLRRVERLLEGGREPSTFLQWQKEMRNRDLKEKLEKIECKRLEGHISFEEAAMSRAKLMEQNQRAARLKKEETAEMIRKYAETRLQEEKEMRELVQQMAESNKNSKIARERLQQFKKSIVKEVSEQSRELLSQALDEAQAELSRKFQIISEIHAIESLPHIRLRMFDDTETAGHELLGEMSLAELRERLSILRDVQQEEEQDKRGQIMMEKHNKKQMLLNQLDGIGLHQRALAQAAATRKEEKKTRFGFLSAVAEDKTILALQKRLQEKQLERQRMKHMESEKTKTSEHEKAHTVRNIERSIMKNTLGADKLKETSWMDLELSLERHIQTDDPQHLT